MNNQEKDAILFWLEEHNTSNKKGKINILKAPIRIYLESLVEKEVCESCRYFDYDFQHQMCGFHKYCSLEKVASCKDWKKKDLT